MTARGTVIHETSSVKGTTAVLSHQLCSMTLSVYECRNMTCKRSELGSNGGQSPCDKFSPSEDESDPVIYFCLFLIFYKDFFF